VFRPGSPATHHGTQTAIHRVRGGVHRLTPSPPRRSLVAQAGDVDVIARRAVEGLAAATGGAISRDECRTAGLTDEQLKWLLESGRWQLPYPRVFVTFSGPVPVETRQFAALLYAGSGSVLSHDTAGRCWRLSAESPQIHVLTTFGRQVDDQPGLVLHRSRTISEADVHPTFVPRRTTIDRTVLDLLASKETAAAALGLVSDAIRGRLTDAERIRQAIEAKPKTRWRRVVLDALPDLRAGARSVLELLDARMRRAHGLPAGKRQVGRRADGTEYLDVVVEEYDLHVELDGRMGHDDATGTWRDMRRDNRSERERKRHLRYGWADMYDRPCEVAIEQGVILRQQGWGGQFKRCRNCPPTLPPGL
jgi:hypothetical protein